MRWLTFALLAGLVLCVHTTLGRSLSIAGAQPDLMFVLLVHYALHARRTDGLIAGWVLGLLTDLSSVERLGVVSLVYGLMTLAIWLIRDLMFVRHPLTHFFVTTVFCFVAQLVLRSYDKISYDSGASFLSLGIISLLSAAYTGLWAVLIHRLLLKLAGPLGLRGTRDDGPRATSGGVRFV